MLKKVDKFQLKPGMFVEDFEGKWDDNPIGMRRFRLESNAQIDLILNSKLDGVIINTALGDDVTRDTRKAASRASGTLPREEFRQRKTTVQAELSQAEAAASELFGQVLKGNAVAVADIAPVVNGISGSVKNDPILFLSLTRLKLKDETTFLHSIAVSALMMLFARYLKFDEETVQTLGSAGLLHDVGKLKLPDEILKKDGKLSEEELASVRQHPVVGAEWLGKVPGISAIVVDLCLHHHERMDGKGYPDGLKGDQISLHARMLTICDVFDAVTSQRPYKKAWAQSEALAWMLETQGHFDRHLLHHFVACLWQAAVASSTG